MTILAISVDDAEASRKLAAREGIRFPLLADGDLAVSRQYVGVDDNDLAVPGIVLVRPDGTIAYRRISGDKADRPSVRDLLAEIDRAFGPPASTPAVRGGFAPTERLQLSIAAGGGAVRLDDGWRGTFAGDASALVPLGRHLLVGGGLGVGLGGPGTRGAVDGAAALRLPFYDDLAAVRVIVHGGYGVGALDGWRAGARLDLGFAATPSWAIQLRAGAAVLDVGGAEAIEAALVLEVTRLVRIR